MVITVQYGKAFWRKLEASDNQSREGKEGGRRTNGGQVIGFSWLPLRGGKQMGQGSKARLGTSLLTLSEGLIQGCGTIRGFYLSSSTVGSSNFDLLVGLLNIV